MAYDYTRSTRSFNDPFGDGAHDEPFSSSNFHRDDTKTFGTYRASGIPVEGSTLAGSTNAVSLTADYRQTNSSPSPEPPSRLPTPSDTLFDPSDSTMNTPYRDDDFHPSSLIDKPEVSLVHNAADMGKSSRYQDLGMPPLTGRKALNPWSHRVCRAVRSRFQPHAREGRSFE